MYGNLNLLINWLCGKVGSYHLQIELLWLIIYSAACLFSTCLLTKRRWKFEEILTNSDSVSFRTNRMTKLRYIGLSEIRFENRRIRSKHSDFYGGSKCGRRLKLLVGDFCWTNAHERSIEENRSVQSYERWYLCFLFSSWRRFNSSFLS